MATFDLTPLYLSTVGFDRLASVIDTVYRTETSSAGYPPYDIEVRDQNEYPVTIAAAGFEQEISRQERPAVFISRYCDTSLRT